MKSLDIKISEASRNVKANTRLNESLENKMIKKIDNVLEELNLYSLVDQRSDITKKQESLKYALDMAKDKNVDIHTPLDTTIVRVIASHNDVADDEDEEASDEA